MREPAAASAPDRPRHHERLTVPWWSWLAALALTALVSAEVRLGAPGVATLVPYAVLLPLAGVALGWLGRAVVTVSDGELRVDDAKLPVRFVGSVTVLDATARRDVLGPYAEPYAFVVQRPWIAGAVQVHLDDPADPTPYWVVSSRRPAELAAAIHAEAQAVRAEPDVPGPGRRAGPP